MRSPYRTAARIVFWIGAVMLVVLLLETLGLR
jgi:uncharacterized membrane protein YtjA (UPF0391 family)